MKSTVSGLQLIMVYPSLACLLAAFSSAVLGFGILSGTSAAIAKGLFVLFIILLLALLGYRPKKKLVAGSSYAQWARAEESETPQSTILEPANLQAANKNAGS